ncbi:nicotinamidase [Aureimonas sp. Leaf454]|uniref:bifunctional nicotinamidase/pyrazinamidase n=1 Tax=Aureimonas sp. Leaf454 TaxID=1736381 RepID=UPI0006F43E23|nr:bifunctional nicotinamidase/pyrazinamidase [Aureimonas sp. Leaf454]KQT51019.1 nicotinamidase [Aureimonas sp. Leaf454]
MTTLLPSDALLVIDVQNDFCTGGALAVPGGEEVVPLVNRIAAGMANVVLTQDWHPRGHISFASTHGRMAFETMEVPYGLQVLWPDHCIGGTTGADFHRDLDMPHAQAIIRKGYRSDIDSYSGLVEADRRTPTGLAGYFEERGIRRIFVAGLALDFCVAWTALDARARGLEVVLVEDACRAIDLHGSRAAALSDMDAAGVVRSSMGDLFA